MRVQISVAAVRKDEEFWRLEHLAKVVPGRDRDPTLYAEEDDAETRALFFQLLCSYKVNPRTVFFLGYSEGQEGNESIELTTMPWAVFLKVGYAWVR